MTTATVNLVQQEMANQLPFCPFDPSAMFHAIEFNYPMLVQVHSVGGLNQNFCFHGREHMMNITTLSAPCSKEIIPTSRRLVSIEPPSPSDRLAPAVQHKSNSIAFLGGLISDRLSGISHYDGPGRSAIGKVSCNMQHVGPER